MAAPKGNQHAVKDKRWRQAIDRALENRSRVLGIQALDAIVEQMISVALGEDEKADIKDRIAVWRELADRLDGKAHQSTELSGSVAVQTLSEIIASVKDVSSVGPSND